MKKAYLLFFVFAFSHSLLAQNPDNEALIGISDYTLVNGTYSYRAPNTSGGVGNFFDRTTWDSSPYGQGHLKQVSNNRFVMNYRYLTPQGYNANYAQGYPLVVLLHGYVERGNCWFNPNRNAFDCWNNVAGANQSYQRHLAPNAAISTNNRNNLLNNDHQLLNGGKMHLDAWTKAGTKLPEDPTLHTKAFPGFVLAPQMYNGWTYSSGVANAPGEWYNMIRIVRLFIQQNNIDPDRVYIHGLSNGGQGVLYSVAAADWLFAAALPMSAVTTHANFTNDVNSVNRDVTTIPMWFFQGGQDLLPTPAETETTIKNFREKGGLARYTLYPSLGHGVWNTAYAEPDFFTWMLSKNKSDLHVEYGLPRVCSSVPGDGVKLYMPREMWAFQWEKDGVLLSDNTSILNVTAPGVYRGRFSRVQNPTTEAQWNQWSKPVEIGTSQPSIPTIGQVGSIHMEDLNQDTTATLTATPGYYKYNWFRTTAMGTPTLGTNSVSNDITWWSANPTSSNSSRSYVVKGLDIDNCPSAQSVTKTVWMMERPSPANIAKPTNFKGTLNGPVDVLLTWDDLTGSERGYEIWRSKASTANSNTWTLVSITAEDAVLFNDVNLEPGVTYYYKLRAVSNIGRSDFAPSNVKDSNLLSDNVIVTTLTDQGAPTAPQNVTAEIVDTEVGDLSVSVLLKWNPSTDDAGVHQYRINYNDGQGISGSILTGTSDTSRVVSGPNFKVNRNLVFTVQALDKSNNASAPSSQVNLDSHFDGLYWNHNTSFYTDLAFINDEQWKMREFTGKSLNISTEPATQEAYVLIRFFGYIYINTPGTYKFRTTSNDGTHIYFDGDTLIFHNQVVPIGECLVKDHYKDKILELEEGPHTVEIRYWQSEDDMCLSWEWQGPDAGQNPEGWYPVPNERLRSYDTNPPPLLPDAPTNLSAVATGTSQITLDWDYFPSSNEFEIHRSLSENGTYSMIARVAPTEHIDINLSPGVQYFYKLRAVNENGVSPFTPSVNATTNTDATAPTVPTGLVLYANTLTSASVGWSHSIDNVGVVGYELYLDGVYHSSTSQNFSVLLGLPPQTDFVLTVVAYDASNNKSAPSDGLAFNTRTPEYFYSKTSGDLTVLSTWGKQTDGGGVAPVNFSTNGYIFVVSNRTSAVVPGPWTVQGGVSKIVVNPNTTLDASNAPVQGNIELQDNSSLILASNTQPTFLSIAPSSTVQYNAGATQIQPVSYGNLSLIGAEAKTFADGITTVRGNLVTTAGTALNGAGDNGSQVILYGDLTIAGVPGAVASNSTIHLDVRKGSLQNLAFNGTLSLFQLSTNATTPVQLVSAGTSTLSLGSAQGGGLFLPTGSSFSLNNNTLSIVGAGAVNSTGETGQINTFNGTIDIASSSDLHSNLYFHPSNNQLADLNVNASGSGNVNVNSALRLIGGIKVRNGDLNSNGFITMVSNASATANLQEIEGTGRVVGDVNVQRYFNVKAFMYRYISTPVQGTSVGDWQQFFSITGPFTGASPGATGASLYSYNNAGVWAPYPTNADGGLDAPIIPGKGYAAYIRNNITFTMNSVGEVNQGPIPFTLFGPAGSSGGWNLVGNPYASTIRWTTSTAAWSNKADISNIISVRNNTSTTAGQHLYYDCVTNLGTSTGQSGPNAGTGGTLAGGLIAPGQAFYVQATGPSPSLTINEAAKFNAQQTFYREDGESQISHLFINLKQGEYMDQAVVTFTEFGSDDYDVNFDASKLKNEGMFNFSTMTSNGKEVAINNMSNAFCDKTIALSIDDVTEGQYVLEFPSPESFYGTNSLRLYDKYLNKTVEVTGNLEYAFEVTSDPLSFGKNRFEIAFNRPDLSSDVDVLKSASCNSEQMVTLSNTQKGASYSIVDTNGAIVGASQLSKGDDLMFSVPSSILMEGVNSFKVNAFFEGCSTQTLSESIVLEKYTAPILTLDDVSTCSGASAMVQVMLDNPSVKEFAWYNGDNVKVKGYTSNYLETEPILTETVYSVAVILKNGCEGPRQGFVVYPEELAEPELILSNDSLFTTVVADKYEWRKNGEVIDVAQSNSITGLTAGSYEVTCWKGGCEKTSKVFSVTGAEESYERVFVSTVFPNPASNANINLKVVTPSNDDVLVKVIDVLGKEHYIQTFDAGSLRESVKITPKNVFRSGVYYVIVKQNQYLREVKFMIRD
jgi:hypothetical protein